MSVQLVISTDTEEVKQNLTGLAGKAADLSPVFKVFEGYMDRQTAKNFKAGGRPAKWPVSIRAQAADGQTLVKSRILQNSITAQFDSNSFTLGTNVIYARIHQLGGKAGRGRKVTIPARPYLVFLDANIKYLLGQIRKRFE